MLDANARVYIVPYDMTGLLNVAKLVDRAAPPSQDRRATWLRRCQLWSVAGILPAVPPAEGGGRRRRLYRADTVWLAAVLLRISDLGLDTSIIQKISSFIQGGTRSRRQRFSRFWHEAIEGSRDTAYFVFSLEHDVLSYDWNGEGLEDYSYLCSAPLVVLNLVELFEEVRYAAES